MRGKKSLRCLLARREGKKKKGRKVRVKIWGRQGTGTNGGDGGQCRKTGAKMEEVDTWAPVVCHLLALSLCAQGKLWVAVNSVHHQKLQGRDERIAGR